MSDPANPKRLYREFIFPPWPNGDPNFAIDLCNKVNGNGWYFEYPRYLEGINHPRRDREPTYQATNCKDVDPEVLKNEWLDMAPGSPTFGKLHPRSGVNQNWGHYPVDPETGIARARS